MDQASPTRISIQVSLSGFSFSSSGEGPVSKSGWLGAEKIFTTKEFQRRYDEVEIALMTPKVALVPNSFFDASEARRLLSETVSLSEGDVVEHVDVPEYDARLLYSPTIGEVLSSTLSRNVLTTSGDSVKVLPEMYYVLKALSGLKDYNRIVASYADGHLYLAIGQGRNLLLANVFEASDFTTAEYFIFLCLKKLQLNPEVSGICFRTPLAAEEEMSLYRYFKAVESL